MIFELKAPQKILLPIRDVTILRDKHMSSITTVGKREERNFSHNCIQKK